MLFITMLFVIKINLINIVETEGCRLFSSDVQKTLLNYFKLQSQKKRAIQILDISIYLNS